MKAQTGLVGFLLLLMGCQQGVSRNKIENIKEQFKQNRTHNGMDTITFGAGCFWCTEAVFQQVKGVQQVTSGYSNGQVKNPTYEEVCTGNTGHAEVIRVVYDPDTVSFPELLEIFWLTHDPTTLNQQGADKGTQYRSGIYYHTEEQREIAELYKAKLDSSGAFSGKIVTEILPVSNYSDAEPYHQNYYNLNSGQGYCSYVIKPKLDKFRKVFSDYLRE